VKYRDWAERLSRKRFLQAIVFAPLLLLTIAVITAPLDVYSEVVEKEFGISVQGWGSWSWDWIKGQLISLVIFTILIWLLYLVIRRSPRRWWFYFWLVSLPIIVFVIFITPWVIDPLFHKFEPLQQKDATLTAALEQLVQRAGENIPPERMFWMGAAEKTTALDAYVTGIGASKRIVVYDTTIAKATVPQIVFGAGHEMGHYVLLHVPKSIAFFAGLFLLFFYFRLPPDRVGTGALGEQVGDSGCRRLGLFAGSAILIVSVLVCGQSSGERLQPASGASSRSIRPGSNAWSHARFGSGRSASISEDRRSRFGGPGSESSGCLFVLRPSNYARPRSVFIDV
jgi:Zn-dependent protease with chaperone function